LILIAAGPSHFHVLFHLSLDKHKIRAAPMEGLDQSSSDSSPSGVAFPWLLVNNFKCFHF
jgi:hypothetical protein